MAANPADTASREIRLNLAIAWGETPERTGVPVAFPLPGAAAPANQKEYPLSYAILGKEPTFCGGLGAHKGECSALGMKITRGSDPHPCHRI